MIDYQTYCQIRELYTQKKLRFRQIARELNIDLKTVRKWARRQCFEKAPSPKRHSKLDPFKGQLVRLLERHDYSARQLFQQRSRVIMEVIASLKTLPAWSGPNPSPPF